MNQNYYHYGLLSHYHAPVMNGYCTMPVSTQPYHNTAHATSHGTYPALPQSLPLPSYAPVHTISWGSNVQGSSVAHRSPSINIQSSNALFPYNPAVVVRNRATSDVENSALVTYTQRGTQSSALFPYTGQPSPLSTITTRPNRASSLRQRAPRNCAPSSTSTSSCSTHYSTHTTSSSTRAGSSTEVVHISAGVVNVYIIYHQC
ncbi:uncharacterized protein ARMOST_22150 [Armillaria ostoyae]|uniref:Uncharacterized protein n=1 Tax=Armillaria ostoyae TaxID=47428 RepID=A0A284SC27_ARMOS|nr:uncharacterized protein ARMOST_22150 [Armillaria ostoyae]